MCRWRTRAPKKCGRAARVRDEDLPEQRRLQSPHSATPQTHLLSNGRYHVMLTGAGSGYSGGAANWP